MAGSCSCTTFMPNARTGFLNCCVEFSFTQFDFTVVWLLLMDVAVRLWFAPLQDSTAHPHCLLWIKIMTKKQTTFCC